MSICERTLAGMVQTMKSALATPVWPVLVSVHAALTPCSPCSILVTLVFRRIMWPTCLVNASPTLPMPPLGWNMVCCITYSR